MKDKKISRVQNQFERFHTAWGLGSRISSENLMSSAFHRCLRKELVFSLDSGMRPRPCN